MLSQRRTYSHAVVVGQLILSSRGAVLKESSYLLKGGEVKVDYVMYVWCRPRGRWSLGCRNRSVSINFEDMMLFSIGKGLHCTKGADWDD